MKIPGGSSGTGEGTLTGGPGVAGSAGGNDGLDRRRIAEVRRERAAMAAEDTDETELDWDPNGELSGEATDALATGGPATDEVGDGGPIAAEPGALGLALEQERTARRVAELRLGIERAAFAAGAVDTEAVSALVLERVAGMDADATLETAALVAEIRAEKPSLFAIGSARAGSEGAVSSRSGVMAPAWGLGGAGLSSSPGTGSGAALTSLATSARANSADRRALLRYLRARRGV